jgi:hypothetical protein
VLGENNNAANHHNYRTGQYALEHGILNLQGGGRWFKSSIAHLKERHFAGKTPHKNDAQDTLPGLFTAIALQPV